LVAADLNADGKPDLIYTEIHPFYSEVVHVLINHGDGSFVAGQDIPFPSSFIGLIQVGDVNSDGIPDIILAMSGASSELAVALGNGDGTFQPLIISAIPSYSPNILSNAWPASIGIADLKGNGTPDLVISDRDSSHILLCYGDNAGHFSSTTTLDNYGGPREIYLGDYNGDGRIDFIVHEAVGATASVYLNKGDGTFQAPVIYQGPDNIGSLVVTDIDGDGHPDMVITGFDNNLTILHGNPDGTFTTAASTPITVGAHQMFPVVIDVEDYNHDGNLDIALESLDGVHILLGKGNYKYSPLAPAPVSNFPGQVAIGDLNQDGFIDFAFPVSNGIAILYGQSGGRLHSADSYDVGYVVSDAILSDFAGNGNTDVAVAVDSLNPRILLGQPDGTFALQPDTNTSASGENTGSSVDAGDFNGDGHPDLLIDGSPIFFPGIPGLAYQLGAGNGTFSPLTGILGYSGTADSGYVGYVAGDLNNDGFSDILVDLNVLLSQGDGTFRKAFTFPTLSFVTGSVSVFADFNHDGKLDAAFVGNQELQIETGRGDGTFGDGYSYFHGEPGYAPSNHAIAADLDGDGNLDIATGLSSQVQIFYGRGDGTFDSPQFINVIVATEADTTCCVNGIAVADFNKDGLPDIALTTSVGVSILHGTGNRTFGPQIDYLAGDAPFHPLIGDFNHDGYPDIAVANADVNRASTITVLLNTPDSGDVSGTLSANPEPSNFGLPFTLSLAVNAQAAGAAVPTGSATLYIDGIVGGSASLSGGVAVFQVTSSLPIGNHAISATYSGDANFHSATFTINHSVMGLISSTALTSSLNPATHGNTVTFTATVSSHSGTPTGTVAFSAGGTTLGTASVTKGIAAYSTASLPTGSDTITATFTGNGGFANSSGSMVETVSGLASTTSLVVSPNPTYVLSRTVLTATVTGTGATPSGTVSFAANGMGLGTATVDASGTATLSYSFSSVGTVAITAAYSGDATFGASTSPPFQENVLISPTTTSVSASPSPAFAFESTMLIVRVTPGGGSSSNAVPGGTVTFYDGAKSIGTGALNADGNAAISSVSFQAGTHSITAVYAGNSDFATSTSAPYLLVVNPDLTITVASAAPNPAQFGAPVLINAAVSAVAIPTGTVTFYDGRTAIGTATVDANGNAGFTTSSLSVGTHAITASFGGSTNFGSSVSAVVNEVILSYTGSFSITVTPKSANLYTGESAQFNATVTPVGGWNGDVTLTCSQLPIDTTCAFGTATITAGNGTTSLIIQTAAPQHADSGPSSHFPWRHGTTAGLALALMILPWQLRRSRFLWKVIVLAAIGGASGIISGCGAGPVTGGTPPGAYNVSVNATYTAGGQPLVVQTATIVLTVKTLFR
jgi:hypothetical protein